MRQNQCDLRRNAYYTYFVGAVAVLSDFYLAIIPINMFIGLRIDRKLKWGLCFLMGCGVFAGVAAIVRTWAAKFILDADSSCKTDRQTDTPLSFLLPTSIPQSPNTITFLQTVLPFSSSGGKSKSGLSSLPCAFPRCGPFSGLSRSNSSRPPHHEANHRITRCRTTEQAKRPSRRRASGLHALPLRFL